MIPENDNGSNTISKEKMKKFGVVYTPLPIIEYILSGIECFLKTHFETFLDRSNNKSPLRNLNVYYLDPAAGNGEFPIALIKKNFKHDNECENAEIKDFVSRIYCYEVLTEHYEKLKENMRKYLKFSNQLLNVYNIDTLLNPETNPLPKAKKNNLLIILGNPPYSVSTNNTGAFIKTLIEDYKKKLISRGSKKITSLRALQDDYIKFIRYAQYTLNQKWPNPGMIAFVVNHYFLDGIIFSGMRKSLSEEFDVIYVLDLNGEQKKEIPKIYIEHGITKDENLFDIKTGFCLIFLIKLHNGAKNTNNGNCAQVYFKELYGSKQIKELYLNKGFSIEDFQRLSLNDQYIFKETEVQLVDYPEYHSFVDINDIFIKSSQGIVTAHDSLVSDYDLTRLKQKIAQFFRSNSENFDENGIIYGKGRDWDPNEARRMTNEQKAISQIIKWAYRGFDRNYLCYDLPLINSSTHRYALMKYLMPKENRHHSDNLAICMTRESYSHDWNSVLMVDIPIDNGMISGSSGSRSYVFLLRTDDINIHQKWRDLLSIHFKTQIDAEDLIFYIYAILWTPTYRKRYGSLLKKEFPKVPLLQWQGVESFFNMVNLGKELSALHCFHLSEETKKTIQRKFPVSHQENLYITLDSESIYSPKEARIYFNPSFWIDAIPEELWNFEIGGIRQLENWIKNRKYSEHPKKSHKTLPRALMMEEIQEFQTLCFIIKETIRLMKKIDDVYRKSMNIENQKDINDVNH